MKKRLASRLRKPQNVAARDAIQSYSALTEKERRDMLDVFDRVVARILTCRRAEADAEIAQIRAARKTGGRRIRIE